MEWLKWCSAAVGAVTLLALLRQFRSETATPVSMTVCVLLIGGSAALLAPTISTLAGLMEQSGMGGYTSVLLRGMGISVVVRTAADICRDCGESAIAAKVELVGRAELLALALPLIKTLSETALSLTGA